MAIPFADGSFQAAVFSPPYWGLRAYSTGDSKHMELGSEKLHDCGAWSRGLHEPYIDWRIDDDTQAREPYIAWRHVEEIKLCGECFICHSVAYMREVKRVLRDDGVVFCNVGDSYYSNTKGTGGPTKKQASNPGSFYDPIKLNGHGLKPKDLCLIPERLALALQADGWWVRAPIIWHKPNPMPGSQQDRPTIDFEFVWMLTKSARYYFDMEAVREDCITGNSARMGIVNGKRFGGDAQATTPVSGLGTREVFNNPASRSMRAVWKIPTQSYSGSHYATYPEELVLRCLKASTSERGACPKCGKPWVRVVEKESYITRPTKGRDTQKAKQMPEFSGGLARVGGHVAVDVTTIGWQPGCKCGIETTVPCRVYDPFIGSGTSIVAARRLGLAGFGTDLSMQYLAENARERIAKQRNGYKNGARPGGKR